MIRNIDGVPVIFVPDYCTNDVDALWNDLPFDRRENTPRTECWMNDYGYDYTYGSGNGIRTYTSDDWNDFVYKIREKLNENFNADFDCCFCNGYINERDHLGWHADDSPEMDMNHPIASVSFGAAREIWFRKKGESGVATKGLLLTNGSVAIMNSGMQFDWEHRIPKHSAPCGKRISLTYRKLVR